MDVEYNRCNGQLTSIVSKARKILNDSPTRISLDVEAPFQVLERLVKSNFTIEELKLKLLK